MSENVSVALVGYTTYATLAAVYKAGEVRSVTPEVWGSLKDVLHVNTGKPVFALTDDEPTVPVTVAGPTTITHEPPPAVTPLESPASVPVPIPVPQAKKTTFGKAVKV